MTDLLFTVCAYSAAPGVAVTGIARTFIWDHGFAQRWEHGFAQRVFAPCLAVPPPFGSRSRLRAIPQNSEQNSELFAKRVGRFTLVAVSTVFRAVFGYYFLVFVVRIVGRRPGKQLTPFEFVLIFFLGGLILTGIVANEVSVTNAICQIFAIASAHSLLVVLSSRSPRLARLLDGMPLVLLEGGHWRTRTLHKMRIADTDVMAMARDQGLKSLHEIDTAILERNGEISILPAEEKNSD